MKKPIVTDSACLIGLERIGCLDILPALFDPIIIPPEVQREFGGPLDWLQVKVPNNQALINALKLLVDDGDPSRVGGVGRGDRLPGPAGQAGWGDADETLVGDAEGVRRRAEGEAEAIALAYEHHSLLILDDRQARSVAQRLTIPIIGTIGVLLLAKQAGILASVGSILIELESASFYVSDALKREALRLAGE